MYKLNKYFLETFRNIYNKIIKLKFSLLSPKTKGLII